jgi:hypothetical protein
MIQITRQQLQYLASAILVLNGCFSGLAAVIVSAIFAAMTFWNPTRYLFYLIAAPQIWSNYTSGKPLGSLFLCLIVALVALSTDLWFIPLPFVERKKNKGLEFKRSFKPTYHEESFNPDPNKAEKELQDYLDNDWATRKNLEELGLGIDGFPKDVPEPEPPSDHWS